MAGPNLKLLTDFFNKIDPKPSITRVNRVIASFPLRYRNIHIAVRRPALAATTMPSTIMIA